MNAARPSTQVPISTFIQHSPQSRKEIGPLPEAISLEEGTSLVCGTSSSTTPLHPTQLQTMVVVGGGTAAAQVLHEMNRLNASEKMPYADQLCIVANYDGWHPSQRGTGYINHQYELIAHYGDTVPEYSTDYADRATFSKTNDAIIQQSVEKGACRIRSEVSKIERFPDGNFRLHFLTGNPVDAKRVILATGLGKDTTLFDVPDTATGRTQVQARMKNMQFVDQAILRQQRRTITATELSVLLDQHPDEFTGKKFVVQGSFVPVDVVQKLKMKLGADAQIVAWINHREPVNFLEGHKLDLAFNEFKEHAYAAKEQVKISPLDRSGKKVGVKINIEPVNSDGKSLGKPETEWHELIADYYVYGLGADPELAGSGKVLLGNLVNQLEPIYDFDQTITTKPYQTVLGLEIRGANSEQGLTIIGGAATSLAGHVKHDFLEHASIDVISYAKSMSPTLSQQLSDAIKNKSPSSALIKLVNSFANSSTFPSKLIKVLEQCLDQYIEARQHFSPEIDDPTLDPRPTPSVTQAMHHLGSTQVASVITSAQLSSVRSAISGITAMIPPYSVQGKMNYSLDNATQMRVAIAQGYEQRKDLPQKQVEKFIADVIHIRTLTHQAFVMYAVNEIVEQEIMPLLNANKSAKEVTQKLCSLKISSDAAEKCVAYVFALQIARKSNAIPPSMPPDLIVDLKSELTALFYAGPKPVHGVPDSVRKGYESYLVALQNGERINASLAKYWLT